MTCLSIEPPVMNSPSIQPGSPGRMSTRISVWSPMCIRRWCYPQTNTLRYPQWERWCAEHSRLIPLVSESQHICCLVPDGSIVYCRRETNTVSGSHGTRVDGGTWVDGMGSKTVPKSGGHKGPGLEIPIFSSAVMRRLILRVPIVYLCLKQGTQYHNREDRG